MNKIHVFGIDEIFIAIFQDLITAKGKSFLELTERLCITRDITTKIFEGQTPICLKRVAEILDFCEVEYKVFFQAVIDIKQLLEDNGWEFIDRDQPAVLLEWLQHDYFQLNKWRNYSGEIPLVGYLKDIFESDKKSK